MPFKSEKQRKYLWKNNPKLARQWTDKYGSEPKKTIQDVARERLKK